MLPRLPRTCDQLFNAKIFSFAVQSVETKALLGNFFPVFLLVPPTFSLIRRLWAGLQFFSQKGPTRTMESTTLPCLSRTHLSTDTLRRRWRTGRENQFDSDHFKESFHSEDCRLCQNASTVAERRAFDCLRVLPASAGPLQGRRQPAAGKHQLKC